MPHQYPIAFRQELVDRMLANESVLSLVAETGVPEQTLHRWKGQSPPGLIEMNFWARGHK